MKSDRVRVMPAPGPEAQQGRSKERSRLGDRRATIGPLVWLLAGLALIWVINWSATAPAGQTSDPQIASIPLVEPIGALVQVGPSAADTVQSLVAAVNRGDVDAATKLMSPEIPEVVGLGSVSFPRLSQSVGLWGDGSLDRDLLAGFVHEASQEPAWLLLSDCDSFADGPRVTIAACAYSLTGPPLPGGFRKETGQLFGFVVDGAVAGLAHRTDDVVTIRHLD